MDPALVQSITAIGYLGTHEGAISDHIMAYVDMDQKEMFAGLINKPPPLQSREIQIEQEDKVQAFLRVLRNRLDDNTIAERTYALALSFAEHKASDENIRSYNKLYGQFLEIVNGTSKEIGRKDIGYARSPPLAAAGSLVILFRKVNDCRRRGAPPTKALMAMGERLQVDITELMELESRAFWKRWRKSRELLKERQKESKSLRREWMMNDVKKKAQAAGDQDWERRLDIAEKKLERNAVNRKLTAITKGPRGALKMIQVPTHDWFYSEAKRELYHYHNGVFEAHPAATETLFHSHHTRKVLPSRVQAVIAERDNSQAYWIITTILPLPRPLWRDITSTEEIEAELLQRNKMHLEQTAREGGLSTGQAMSAFRENFGFNPVSEAVLDGEQIEYELTSELTAFFQAIKRTDKERSLPPVVGIITSADFQQMFKVAKERTSSDPRTPNYSIWKCLAKSDRISGFASVLLSLPFIYGFPNQHWTHMTDFMLEKKPGVRQIHMLRIIGKLAAEFNTCLKLIISKQARDNFENSETCDEQHGFRPNRSSQDAMMLKLLTFEAARMQKCTVGALQHDMTAHFDRMIPAVTAAIATKYGVTQNVMKSIGATIQRLERNVETSLGLSEGVYRQEVDSPELGGMVQGKADVPQLSTLQSNIMLQAHKSLSYGVNISSPELSRSIEHHSIAFADDTEGQVSSDTQKNIIPRLVRKLQHSGQTWSNLTDICGGLIAHHKCFWQLLAWEVNGGHLTPMRETDEQVILGDGKGAYAGIQFVPPDEPNVGLGFSLCPDGNQQPHFDTTLAKVRDLCTAAGASHLTEGEAHQLLYQRMVPKLSYALHGTAFTVKQCRSINTLLRRTFLPSMKFNRNFPSAVLYGSLKYGGMEFPETNTLQDQVQLDYIIKQLRWDRSVANAFLVTLDLVQMCSGFTDPIFETTAGKIEYLQPSYILALRHRLYEMDAFLWIEKKWTPRLQRRNDTSLMQTFLACPQISRAMLKRANAVRLYLRVVTIADLADVGGTYIPAGILTGEWRAGSDYKWPYQPLPPANFWSTFRRCIRLTFCTNTPPYSHPSHSLTLDVALGKWFIVPRNTWFICYRSSTAVFWRKENGAEIYAMTHGSAAGFYHISHTVESIPLDCHPIRYREIKGTLWTHGKYAPRLRHITTVSPGAIIEEPTLSEPIELLTLGSDGSVNLRDAIATCAWMLHQSETNTLKACYILEDMTSLSSYRSELEGMYRGLKQITALQTQPQRLDQWCDNKAAVDRSNSSLYTPGSRIQPDADILMAIHHVQTMMEGTTDITCRHVYGHQDTRPSKQPQQNEYPDTSTGSEASEDEYIEHATRPRNPNPTTKTLQARINIECDKIATETAEAAREQTIQRDDILRLPYEGSRAILNIGGRWVTSQQRRYICEAKWDRSLQDYCCRRYEWTSQVFHSVRWKSIHSVRKNMNHYHRRQTSKIMHGWLPVMHRQGIITGSTQCPACSCPDETMEHLFKCKNKALMEKKDTLIVEFRTSGISAGIPRAIMEAFSGLLYAFIHGTEVHLPEHPGIAAAVEAQLEIGLRLLPRGYIATTWLEILEEFGTQNPDSRLSGLLKRLWMDFTNQIWKNRNEIMHSASSKTKQQEENQKAEKLRWYLRNTQVIAPWDRFVLEYNEESIDTMSSYVKTRLIKNLETLERVYAEERTIVDKGQRVIRQFFRQAGTEK